MDFDHARDRLQTTSINSPTEDTVTDVLLELLEVVGAIDGRLARLVLRVQDLERSPADAQPDTVRQHGARYVRLVLAKAGNKRAACRVLGITYHTLNCYLNEPLDDGDDRDTAEAREATP